MTFFERTGYRWVVLGIYAWIAGLSQLLWLNFAPILSLVQKQYGVSETNASFLLLVFPLTYVLLSVHAGALMDRWGYRRAIGAGAVLIAAFSLLRIPAGGFWLLLVAQAGISLGQPYILNGITKLVADWFPPEETTLATGLGTVGLFIGMAIGLAATPPAVELWGMQGAMALFAAVTVVSCVAFFVLCPRRLVAGRGLAGEELGSWKMVWPQLRNPQLRVLFFISFVGLGFFNGLTSWIEAILAPNGIDSDRAGIIGGVLIFGGIAGSVVIPGLSGWMGRRKPFLILSIAVAAVTLVPLCRNGSYFVLLFWGFFQGFFFLPAYALLLDMTALEAGAERAGSATGILMLTGNAGGVLAILALGWLKGEGGGFPSALYFLLALLGLAVVASGLTRESK